MSNQALIPSLLNMASDIRQCKDKMSQFTNSNTPKNDKKSKSPYIQIIDRFRDQKNAGSERLENEVVRITSIDSLNSFEDSGFAAAHDNKISRSIMQCEELDDSESESDDQESSDDSSDIPEGEKTQKDANISVSDSNCSDDDSSMLEFEVSVNNKNHNEKQKSEKVSESRVYSCEYSHMLKKNTKDTEVTKAGVYVTEVLHKIYMVQLNPNDHCMPWSDDEEEDESDLLDNFSTSDSMISPRMRYQNRGPTKEIPPLARAAYKCWNALCVADRRASTICSRYSRQIVILSKRPISSANSDLCSYRKRRTQSQPKASRRLQSSYKINH